MTQIITLTIDAEKENMTPHPANIPTPLGLRKRPLQAIFGSNANGTVQKKKLGTAVRVDPRANVSSNVVQLDIVEEEIASLQSEVVSPTPSTQSLPVPTMELSAEHVAAVLPVEPTPAKRTRNSLKSADVDSILMPPPTLLPTSPKFISPTRQQSQPHTQPLVSLAVPATPAAAAHTSLPATTLPAHTTPITTRSNPALRTPISTVPLSVPSLQLINKPIVLPTVKHSAPQPTPVKLNHVAPIMTLHQQPQTTQPPVTVPSSSRPALRTLPATANNTNAAASANIAIKPDPQQFVKPQKVVHHTTQPAATLVTVKPLQTHTDAPSQPPPRRSSRGKSHSDAPVDGPAEFALNGRCYINKEKIGKGGYGAVYRVEYQHHQYALKHLRLDISNKSQVQSLQLEIDRLKKMAGESRVIQLIDYGIMAMNNNKGVPDSAIVVLELASMDLHTYMQTVDILSMSEVISFFHDMLMCVKACHEHAILHLDLKPANFVLTSDSSETQSRHSAQQAVKRLKLIDFGIAEELESDDATSVITEQTFGTVKYMAPERFGLVLKGQNNKIGPYTDVWSLGCILYQMIYGTTPYGKYMSTRDISNAIVDGAGIDYNVPTKVKLSEEEMHNWSRSELLDIIQQCLIYDSKKRPTVEKLLQHSIFGGYESKQEAAERKLMEQQALTLDSEMQALKQQMEQLQQLHHAKQVERQRLQQTYTQRWPTHVMPAATQYVAAAETFHQPQTHIAKRLSASLDEDL